MDTSLTLSTSLITLLIALHRNMKATYRTRELFTIGNWIVTTLSRHCKDVTKRNAFRALKHAQQYKRSCCYITTRSREAYATRVQRKKTTFEILIFFKHTFSTWCFFLCVLKTTLLTNSIIFTYNLLNSDHINDRLFQKERLLQLITYSMGVLNPVPGKLFSMCMKVD